MAADFLIGIDVGTQSVRALLTNRRGQLRVCASRPTPTLRPKPSWAEHDPEALWQAVIAVLCEVAVQVPAGQTVAGIAVASLGEACVLMDSAGEPLGNIIAWFDRRSEEDAHRISAERLFSITGLAPDPTYTLCKLLWIRRTTRALFARAHRVLNVADWIAFRLSGEAATDFSLASRTACLDLGQRCWSVELLREVDIDIGLLPAIRPSGNALGQVRSDVLKATGLPGRPVVGVGAHDHICGWFAAGAMDEGVLLDSMGTAEAILTAVCRPVTVQDIVRQGYAQGAIERDEPRFYLGGTINSSGGAVEWFRRSFAADVAHQRLIEEASASPAGSNGVCFVPHLSGAGPPFADVPARGALLGLTASTGRGDAFRAVLEGLALEARSVRDAMMVLPGVAVPRSVLVIGGHVRNRLLLEIKASVYRQELRVISEAEATALGAALLAGTAAGLWQDLRTALTEVRREEFNIEPRPDWIDTYEAIFMRSYCRVTPLLRPLNETFQYVPATG
jgi:sugar (pentulose or hexulose) kinase